MRFFNKGFGVGSLLRHVQQSILHAVRYALSITIIEDVDDDDDDQSRCCCVDGHASNWQPKKWIGGTKNCQPKH